MKNVPLIIFLFLLVLILVGFFYIILPFIFTIILAIILAHLFMPVKKFLLQKNFSEGTATLITFCTALVVVIAPLVGIGFLISNETREFYQNLTENFSGESADLSSILEQSSIYQFLEGNSLVTTLTEVFDSSGIKEQLINIVNNIAITFISSIRAFIVNLPTLLINVILWIYLTYFLLKDGKKFFVRLKTFLPIPKEEQDKVVEEIVKMIDATLLGTLAVSISEGTIGAIIFAILGIPGAITWGLLMGLLTMIPILGANGILIPTGIYFLVTGDIGSGLFVFIAGTGTISLIEYILKPKFMGDRSGVHPAIVSIAIIGGIFTMGLIGFVVGPVLASITIAMLEIFRHRLGKESFETNPTVNQSDQA